MEGAASLGGEGKGDQLRSCHPPPFPTFDQFKYKLIKLSNHNPPQRSSPSEAAPNIRILGCFAGAGSHPFYFLHVFTCKKKKELLRWGNLSYPNLKRRTNDRERERDSKAAGKGSDIKSDIFAITKVKRIAYDEPSQSSRCIRGIPLSMDT